MIARDELRFFMGQIKMIAFVFDSKSIKVYKRINHQDLSESSEPTETLLEVWPIQLLDSFELLKQQIEQILRLHENKTAALKKQLLQTTSSLPNHVL